MTEHDISPLLKRIAEMAVDEERRWELVRRLHRSDDAHGVVRQALRFGATHHTAADVTAVLDVTAQVRVADEALAHALLQYVRSHLSSADPSVCATAVYNWMYQAPGDLGAILPLASHSSASVREAVATFLHGSLLESAVECLISLSDDSESAVRNWATTALASLPNDERIVEALVRNAFEDDDETRHEAVLGLARSAPGAARALILRELASGSISAPLVEAIATAPDRAFAGPLRRAQQQFGLELFHLIEQALERCDD